MILGILISFLIVCIVLISLNIYIIISASINLHTQTVQISIYMFRIRLFDKYYDLKDDFIKDENGFYSDDKIDQVHNHLIKIIRDTEDVNTYILNRLKFKQISWHTSIGTGDAQTTGIAGGGLWAVKGAIISLLSNKSKLLCRPSVNVKPCFNETQINSIMNCMITVRLGQAIRVMFKISRKLNINNKTMI